MVVWSNGERFVFRDDEIDSVLDAAESADTQAEAWRRTEVIGTHL